MGMESIDLLLKRNEFEKLSTDQEEIVIYYKAVWDSVYLLVRCNFLKQRQSDAEQLRRILWRIRTDERFAAKDQELLVLLFLRDTAYGRCFIQDNIDNVPAWIVEGNTGRLMIYEGQPSDFAGIRVQLERLSEKGELRQSRAASFVTLCNSVLLVINVLVFLFMSLTDHAKDGGQMIRWGAIYTPVMSRPREWYRILTAMFLHFDVEHLMSNMVILAALGDNLERALGKWRYLLVYLLSGVGAGILSCVYHVEAGGVIVAAGASGAIFGVIGGLFCLVIRNKGRLEELTAPRLALMIMYILYSGFTTPQVDNAAHIGGLLTGFLMAFLLSRHWYEAE